MKEKIIPRFCCASLFLPINAFDPESYLFVIFLSLFLGEESRGVKGSPYTDVALVVAVNDDIGEQVLRSVSFEFF
jgi:hypothetical protein